MRRHTAPLLLVLGMLVTACPGDESPTSPGGLGPIVTTTSPPSYPLITSVAPSIAPPEGGTLMRIHGSNFAAPLRVLFEIGDTTIETFIVSVQHTSIEIVSPAISLGDAERIDVRLRVITRAGMDREMTTTTQIVVQKNELTPSIVVVTPNQAPVSGGARVTIIGEGFQAPVQVLFEQQNEQLEARVVNVRRNEIVAEVPAARQEGAVDVVVRNVATRREARLANGFRYIPGLQVFAISPDSGPAFGGARIRITGQGFIAPVAVTVGGIPVTVLSVSSTEIVGVTNTSGCNARGPVTVVNVMSGESATGPVFQYRCPRRRAA